MYLFLHIIAHTGHDQRGKPKAYFSEKLFVHTRTILHGLLWRCNETKKKFFHIWNFYILATTEMNLMREMKTMTGCGK
jgi:hypothetical protein